MPTDTVEEFGPPHENMARVSEEPPQEAVASPETSRSDQIADWADGPPPSYNTSGEKGALDQEVNRIPEEIFWPPYNFGCVPHQYSSYQDARVVVVPVPYDQTTSWRAGTRDGAHQILVASMNMELYDHELERDVSEVGLYTTSEVAPYVGDPFQMHCRVAGVTERLVKEGKLPLLIGGDHSISIGAVRGVALALGKELRPSGEPWGFQWPIVMEDGEPPFTYVMLDAHPDLRPEYEGTKWGHSAQALRISKMGIPVVQVGLRAADKAEIFPTRPNVWREPAVPGEVRQVWAEAMIREQQMRAWHNVLDSILAACGPRVYLSFDVDVCDPSWMSTTGTPEPGGLSYYQVRDILRHVLSNRQVVGLDCVEFKPTGNMNDAPAYAVARLLYKMVGYAAIANKW